MYGDRDALVNEINEFMHHNDLLFLREGRELFERDFELKSMCMAEAKAHGSGVN